MKTNLKLNHEWMADGFCKWCHNTHRTDFRPNDFCDTRTRLETKDGSTIQPVNGVPTVIPKTHKVVQNLLSGRDVVQAIDTPLCCDVSSETYHCM